MALQSLSVLGTGAGKVPRWLGRANPSYWEHLANESITFPLRAQGGSLSDHIDVMGAGRALARVTQDERRYGAFQFLSADAFFARYEGPDPRKQHAPLIVSGGTPPAPIEPGRVYVQDRTEGKPPFDAEPGDIDIAGELGRRNGVDPWIEGETITFLGPEERKRQKPYVTVVRGASLGLRGAIEDHYALPGDHWHISDHLGPFAGNYVDKQGDSTQLYDLEKFQRADGEIYGVPSKTRRAGFDKFTRIVGQAADSSGGGGINGKFSVALNFAGDTGPGYGLTYYKATPGFDPNSNATAAPILGSGAVLAYQAFAKYGPSSPGIPKGDKHWRGTNDDGEDVNAAHTHIYSKFTNETKHYDGWLHFTEEDEPPVGSGIFPVRTFIMFRPELADPWDLKKLFGGWDLHTRVMSVPIYDDPGTGKGPPTHDPGATKIPPPIDDPGGGTKVPPNDDPGGGTKPPEEPPVPGRPITGDPRDGDGLDHTGDATEPGEVPKDVSPTEIRVPSVEGQPVPGNIDDDVPAVPDWHDAAGDSPSHAEDPDRETGPRGRFDKAEAVDRMTLPFTGHRLSQHFLSPRGAHFMWFYEQKKAEREGTLRGMEGFPANYVRAPILQMGESIQPDRYFSGTANGVCLFAPPELKKKQARFDFSGPMPTLSVHTFGIFTGGKLAWGKLGSKRGTIVDGAQAYLSGSPDLALGLYFRHATTADAVDVTPPFTFDAALRVMPHLTLPASGSSAEMRTLDDGLGGYTPWFWNGSEWTSMLGGGGSALVEVELDVYNDDALVLDGADQFILMTSDIYVALADISAPADPTLPVEKVLFNASESDITIPDVTGGSTVITGTGATYTLGPYQSALLRFSPALGVWVVI